LRECCSLGSDIEFEEQWKAVNKRDRTEDRDPLEDGRRRLEVRVGGLHYRVEELEKANIPRDGGSHSEIF
jgi:hypothetical protein